MPDNEPDSVDEGQGAAIREATRQLRAMKAEVERLREALTDFRAAIDEQRKRRIDESEHDYKLANAVLDDVVAEYALRFTDDAS